ncbi:MAG: tetratricopeptide repeat protein [Planctomycetota bacterium]
MLRGLAADPTSQAVMDRLNLPSQGVNLFDHYKGAGRYSDGIAFVEKLLPLLPTTTPLDRARRAVMHQFAFECHKGLGQFTQAEASIQAAIESDPRNSVYPNSYGLMLRYTGNTAGAMEQFRKALEIAPSHPWAAQNLAGLLMAQGDWAAFHDHCSRALYWAQDTVEQVQAHLTETLDPQRVDGPASQQEIATAQEALDAAKHDLMKMRRLWTEGLQLERAAAAKK